MKIGFCCKWMGNEDFNIKSTTVQYLDRHPELAHNKLWSLVKHNLTAYLKLVMHMATLPAQQRMLRLGSDCLPMYTYPKYRAFYKLPEVQRYLETNFRLIGEAARSLDVRLSFHPGEYCALASDRPEVVSRSLEEVEYHADMIRLMGYINPYDVKITVHVSGQLGIKGYLESLSKLSEVARFNIVAENDEHSGLDYVMHLAKDVPVVLDLHHYLIYNDKQISYLDNMIPRVIDSWGGIRPVIHYSQSYQEAIGKNRMARRAHSDYYWDQTSLDYALEFLPKFDIQCEAKAKNLASQQVYDRAVELGYI